MYKSRFSILVLLVVGLVSCCSCISTKVESSTDMLLNCIYTDSRDIMCVEFYSTGYDITTTYKSKNYRHYRYPDNFMKGYDTPPDSLILNGTTFYLRGAV